MLDNDNGVALIDFGLAKEIPAGSGKSLSAGIHTSGWAPPERTRSETGPTTDVYSLGQLLWHMLTNEEVGTYKPDYRITKLEECGHPRWLADLINNAVVPEDPEKRIQSITEFRMMLEKGNK